MRISKLCPAAVLALATASAGPIFVSSYNAAVTFTDGLNSTTMAMAYDGANYWSVSGGGTIGTRLAEYSGAGALLSSFSPGLDFRSVFTNGSGSVFAREYANSTIYQMTAPGVFSPLLTLSGGSLDNQSSVVLDTAGTSYIAMTEGSVSRWDLSGTYLGSLALSAFGAGDENSYPQNRGIAAAGGYYLTYVNGLLSAWDPNTGARVDQTTLNGGGSSFDSNFSLSFANGMVWVVDEAGGTWRGYDVGLGSAAPPVGQVPEPGTLALLASGFGLLAAYRFRRR